MSSREKILAALKQNQPARQPLPDAHTGRTQPGNLKEKFIQALTDIGGKAVEAQGWKAIAAALREAFPAPAQIINTIPGLNSEFEILSSKFHPHDFRNVSPAILQGQFGVAENGAVWLTNEQMGDQALPYICEHLALIISQRDIIPTLHEAYDRISNSTYRLGAFIAGPSKTADIEQSLVLGAHGPKSLTVFILD
ncbi:MAG: LUD domain-containing protein [Cyclobacteriaceae bacterium]|nr:LUD domain-containing protein [Cyclobacteriaceae bacterium]